MTEKFSSEDEALDNLKKKIRHLNSLYDSFAVEFGFVTADQSYQHLFWKMLDTYSDNALNGVIANSFYLAALGVFNEGLKEHIEHRKKLIKTSGEEKDTVPEAKPMLIRHSVTDGAIMSKTPDDRKNTYRTWGLLTPRNLEKYPVLEMVSGRFVAPDTIDLRDYCTRTADQGSKPWCAAYAAAGFVSNIIWRKEDIPPTIEAEPLYKIAKELDGEPNVDGTTLTAVYQAVLDKGYFDDTVCSVKVLHNKNQVKYAIHKFGCCLLGMMVTKEWYYCNRNKTTISGKDPATPNTPLGGHAVLCCGYNPDGIIIQNSWGVDWGSFGFALVTWDEFEREFSYGAVMDNCLYGTKMN